MTNKQVSIFYFFAHVIFLNGQDAISINKNIAIFIDHGHEFAQLVPGALTKAFMVALSEQEYPIIASFDLWQSFVKHQSKLPHVAFNENDWRVKQVDAYLIFLPKKIFYEEAVISSGPLTADEKKERFKNSAYAGV